MRRQVGHRPDHLVDLRVGLVDPDEDVLDAAELLQHVVERLDPIGRQLRHGRHVRQRRGQVGPLARPRQDQERRVDAGERRPALPLAQRHQPLRLPVLRPGRQGRQE